VIWGLTTAQKEIQAYKKERSFRLNPHKYKSGRAAWKGTEPRCYHLSGEAGVPRGAYYKCEKKKTRNHFPSLLVALQPLGLKGVGKKGQGRDQARRPPPSCFGRHDGDTEGQQCLPQTLGSP
jgi:hypothetical protein